MLFVVQLFSLIFSQDERLHKREEDVLRKIKRFIGEECDIVSRSQKIVAKLETVKLAFGAMIAGQSLLQERQLSVHTGSSPWYAECPVWNPFKTLIH